MDGDENWSDAWVATSSWPSPSGVRSRGGVSMAICNEIAEISSPGDATGDDIVMTGDDGPASEAPKLPAMRDLCRPFDKNAHMHTHTQSNMELFIVMKI